MNEAPETDMMMDDELIDSPEPFERDSEPETDTPLQHERQTNAELREQTTEEKIQQALEAKGSEPNSSIKEFSGDGFKLEAGKIVDKTSGTEWEGFDAETLAQLQTQEYVRLIPDHEEVTADGMKLSVTYIFRDAENNIRYEIHSFVKPFHAENENELFIYERADMAERSRPWQEERAEVPKQHVQGIEIETAAAAHAATELPAENKVMFEPEVEERILESRPVISTETFTAPRSHTFIETIKLKVIAEQLPVHVFEDEQPLMQEVREIEPHSAAIERSDMPREKPQEEDEELSVTEPREAVAVETSIELPHVEAHIEAVQKTQQPEAKVNETKLPPQTIEAMIAELLKDEPMRDLFEQEIKIEKGEESVMLAEMPSRTEVPNEAEHAAAFEQNDVIADTESHETILEITPLTVEQSSEIVAQEEMVDTEQIEWFDHADETELQAEQSMVAREETVQQATAEILPFPRARRVAPPSDPVELNKRARAPFTRGIRLVRAA